MNRPMRIHCNARRRAGKRSFHVCKLRPGHAGQHRCSCRHQFSLPTFLNAYVHSPWMNPAPLDLKISWASFQLFIERLWGSKNTAGHA